MLETSRPFVYRRKPRLRQNASRNRGPRSPPSILARVLLREDRLGHVRTGTAAVAGDRGATATARRRHRERGGVAQWRRRDRRAAQEDGAPARRRDRPVSP